MSYKEAMRRYWDERLPRGWEYAHLADVHRWINRGHTREIVSDRTLRRKAASGAMGAIGGPGTELGGGYRLRRDAVIEYLVLSDVLLAPDPIPSPAPPPRERRRKKRRARRKDEARRGRRRQDEEQGGGAPPPVRRGHDQINLFDHQEDG